MAAIVSTRILRLQAISPRTSAINLQTGINIGNATLIAGTAASTVVSNAASALSGLSDKLNKSASDILSGTITISAAANAGWKIGTITWDSSGTVTGGTGVAITPGGIVAAASGTPTITLRGSDGAATFAGTLSAAGGTLGTITAGTIQGATFRSAASGARITLNDASANTLQLYDSGGTLRCEIGGSSGYVYVNSASTLVSGVSGNSSGAGMAGIAGASSSASGYGVHASNSGGGTALYANGPTGLAGPTTTQDIAPDGNVTRTNSNSSHYWIDTYSKWHYGAGFVVYATNADQTGTGWGMVALQSAHNLAASRYYGGAVPTQGTAPFMYFNVDGKVATFMDAHGGFYNSANW